MIFIYMKIKITEAQAKRLNLINEDNNPLAQFEKFCQLRLEHVNQLYLKVASLSINEILHNQVDISDINKELDKIEDAVRKGSRIAYQYINNRPESEELDIRIDNAEFSVSQRLNALQLITMDLEQLQVSTEQHETTKPFHDVKPMDIGGTQV